MKFNLINHTIIAWLIKLLFINYIYITISIKCVGRILSFSYAIVSVIDLENDLISIFSTTPMLICSSIIWRTYNLKRTIHNKVKFWKFQVSWTLKLLYLWGWWTNWGDSSPLLNYQGQRINQGVYRWTRKVIIIGIMRWQ